MAKKPVVVASTLAVAGLLGIALLACAPSDSYLRVLENNWEIDLPEHGAKTVYELSESSFHGDGVRFHVIDYPVGSETKAMEDTKFQLEKLFLDAENPTPAQVDAIEAILAEQDLAVDVVPEWSKCKLVYQKQADGSELYLLYWDGTGTLYVVESFL